MDKRILDLNLEMSIMSHNGIVHFWKQFNPLIMGTPRHISIMDREFRMHCSNILCIILSDRFSLMTTAVCSIGTVPIPFAYIPSSNKDLTLSFVSAEVANVV